MSRRNAFLPALAIVLAAMSLRLAACAPHVSLNRSMGYGGTPVTDATVDEVPVRGFDVDVTLRGGRGRAVGGELLAVDDEALWLLSEGGRTVRIARDEVDHVVVDVLDPESGAHWAWTVLNAVSTLGNGYFALFTLPGTLAVGIPVSVGAGAADDPEAASEREIGLLYQFARFPQGLPDAWRTAEARP